MIALPPFRKRQSATDTERSSLDTTYTPTYDGATLAALVTRAERAVEQLQSLKPEADRAAELGAMEERIAGIERSLAGVERVAAQLSAVEADAQRLTAAHESTTARIDATNAALDRAREAGADLLSRIDDASSMREQLDRFLALEPQFSAMRRESEGMGSQLRELGESLGRLRAVHDDVLHVQKHATSRLEGIEQRSQGISAKMDAVERRAAAAEEALDALLRIAAGVPDAQHQLAVLKATAEQVSQKTASLEQMRDAVERAATQASDVLALAPQLEGALRRHEEQTRTTQALEAKLSSVQSLHTSVLARADEIAAQQRALDDAGHTAERSLAALRDQMQASAERFELENRSLDAVSERIVELRTGVKECESRLGSLDQTSRTLAETDARAQSLASQVTDLADDVARITAQAERLRAVRDDVGELDRTLTELTERMDRLDTLRPTVDSVLRDLTTLNGTHEAIRDGLEQVRLSYAEMTRLRERQTEVDQWLADADMRVRGLRDVVAELEHARPATEALQEKVDRLVASVDSVDARSAMVDALHRRLGELDSMLAQAQDRGDSLRARMDAAETRFTDLLRQAAEARRVAATIASVAKAVDDADRRMVSVGDVADALAERAKTFTGLEERLRLFTQEFEQRQSALEAATANLAQVSEERREAADAMQRLEELTRSIGAQLGDAERRSTMLGQVLGEIDGRLAELGGVEKRMGNFESLLATWETAQREAALSLEQIGSKQATLDAVGAQVKHVFEIAEKTADHVRSIAAERREIEEARLLLDRTREQLGEATESMRAFAERKWQVDDLERRLARADALARDVRGSAEVLAAQRSVVERVLDRSAALAVQMKQADALVESLRNECAAAAGLRIAVDGIEGNAAGGD